MSLDRTPRPASCLGRNPPPARLRGAYRARARARLHWPTAIAGSHSRLPTPVLTGSGSTGLSQPFASAKSTPDELHES